MEFPAEKGTTQQDPGWFSGLRPNRAEFSRLWQAAPVWVFTAAICLFLGFAMSGPAYMLVLLFLSWVSGLAWISQRRLVWRKVHGYWANGAVAATFTALLLLVAIPMVGKRIDHDVPDTNKYSHAIARYELEIKIAGLARTRDIDRAERSLSRHIEDVYQGSDPSPCVFAEKIINDGRAQMDSYTGKITRGTWVEFGIFMGGRGTFTIQHHELGVISERPIGIPGREIDGGSVEHLDRRVIPEGARSIEFKYAAKMRGGRTYGQPIGFRKMRRGWEVSIPRPCGAKPKIYVLTNM